MHTPIRPVVVLGAAVTLACIAACGPKYPSVYSAADLIRDARTHPGPALIHYLAQDQADAEVCSLRIQGGRVHLDAALIRTLVTALDHGAIAPTRWADCMAEMTPAVESSSLQAVLIDRCGGLYVDLMKGPAIDASNAKIAALREAILGVSPVAWEGSDAQSFVTRVNRLNPDDPVRQVELAQMQEALEISGGRWRGAEVTGAIIDTVSDTRLLELLAKRLPDEALRVAAYHRVVRLMIEASPLPEVRNDAETVSKRMVEGQRNEVPLSEEAIVRSWHVAPTTQVVVRQTVMARRAELEFHPISDALTVEVLHDLPLYAWLRVEVAGYTAPLGLCGPVDGISVEPCISGDSITLGAPWAHVDHLGRVRMDAPMGIGSVFGWAEHGDTFRLEPSVGQTVLALLDFPVLFAPPDPPVFEGPLEANGPSVAVKSGRPATASSSGHRPQ